MDQWNAAIEAWMAGLGVIGESFARLFLAAIAGGLVGMERELRGRHAGFRTNLLVCVGATLAMLVSVEFARPGMFRGYDGVEMQIDPARVAYGIMTGIGFLGAGTIIQDRGTIRGLTTAAGMWSVTAVGLAIGVGMYTVAIFVTLMLLLVLWVLDRLEELIPKQEIRRVTIRRKWEQESVDQTVQQVKQHGVSVFDATYRRVDGALEWVDITLAVGFVGKLRYSRFEKEMRDDGRYELLASETV